MQLRWLILLLLLWGPASFATARNVKGSCGNNGDGTTSACAGSPGGVGAFNTIQACATAMANGDTCTVFAGTYNENVSLPAGGVASYKTLTVNPGDTVYVTSISSLGSHTKLNGFFIQAGPSPGSPTGLVCVTVASGATDWFITNNHMYACGTGAGMIVETRLTSTSHGFIQGNTMSYGCSTSAAPAVCKLGVIDGDYHLIENNDWSHVSDGFYIEGIHNVMRKNTFHDILAGQNSSGGDCDSGTFSGNCHVDFMQADANPPSSAPAQFMLIEGNIIRNLTTVGASPGDTHVIGLFQAEACGGQCNNAIVRFNVASHTSGGGIVDDNSFNSVPPQAWINVKSYNNSWVDVAVSNHGNGDGTNSFDHGSTGGSAINELFYYTFALVDFNPYECQDNGGGVACTGPIAFAFGHNLAFCTTDGINLASPCNLRSHLYGSGSFTGDTGNIVSNPLFLNYSGNDFHLTSGSPAKGAGTNLTTVSSGCSGSTTSITLAAGGAGYFNADSTIPGVQADWIRVGALITSPTVQLSSINYGTDVLTLASAISCSNADPVYLYKDSSGTIQLLAASPDIGAFQFANNPIIPPAPCPKCLLGGMK